MKLTRRQFSKRVAGTAALAAIGGLPLNALAARTLIYGNAGGPGVTGYNPGGVNSRDKL